MALAALWIAGRVLVLTPLRHGARPSSMRRFPWPSRSPSAFRWCRAGNRRNYFFIALLLLLGARRARIPPVAIWRCSMAGAREPAGGTRCRPVHHGRDGRARDSDVHQQRRPRRAGDASPAGSKSSRWAACSCLLGADLLPVPARARRAAGARGGASRTRCGSICGSRGGRCARRWCGCCTWPMPGSSSTSCCADLPRWAGSPSCSPCTR